MKHLSEGAAVIDPTELNQRDGTRRYRMPISRAMGARGREAVWERFNVARMAADMMKVFEHVVRRSGVQAPLGERSGVGVARPERLNA